MQRRVIKDGVREFVLGVVGFSALLGCAEIFWSVPHLPLVSVAIGFCLGLGVALGCMRDLRNLRSGGLEQSPPEATHPH